MPSCLAGLSAQAVLDTLEGQVQNVCQGQDAVEFTPAMSSPTHLSLHTGTLLAWGIGVVTMPVVCRNSSRCQSQSLSWALAHSTSAVFADSHVNSHISPGFPNPPLTLPVHLLLLHLSSHLYPGCSPCLGAHGLLHGCTLSAQVLSSPGMTAISLLPNTTS